MRIIPFVFYSSLSVTFEILCIQLIWEISGLNLIV